MNITKNINNLFFPRRRHHYVIVRLEIRQELMTILPCDQEMALVTLSEYEGAHLLTFLLK